MSDMRNGFPALCSILYGYLVQCYIKEMKSDDINLYIIFKTEITNYSEWKNTL